MGNSAKASIVQNILLKILQIAVFLLFAVMVVLVFAQVFTRFLTEGSLTWSEELSRYVMIWMVYLAAVLTYADKGHIIVDALINVLKGLPNLICQVVSRLCVLLFIVIVTVGAMKFLPITALQRSPANGIVMAMVYISIVISMLLIGLMTTRQIVDEINLYRYTNAQDMKSGGEKS